MLAKGFLSICASSSLSECLFSSGRGIVTYKKEKISPKTIFILVTLKWWDKKDEANSDEEEFCKDVN